MWVGHVCFEGDIMESVPEMSKDEAYDWIFNKNRRDVECESHYDDGIVIGRKYYDGISLIIEEY